MIVAHKLTKTYRRSVTALDGLSVIFPQGDFAFVVGPNGAGKTTFFKLLTREEKATSGCVLLDGRDISTLEKNELSRHRRLVGSVFQDARLIPTRTVGENVSLPLETEGFPSEIVRERTEAALFLTRLEPLANRFPSELSGGQRQQVAIARAVANRPRVILADEPTGNLSPAATIEIVRLLRLINECGITVLFATHDAAVVDQFKCRVIALHSGRLVVDEVGRGYPHLGEKAA
jgi:cell division transport system ATP-binding protein